MRWCTRTPDTEPPGKRAPAKRGEARRRASSVVDVDHACANRLCHGTRLSVLPHLPRGGLAVCRRALVAPVKVHKRVCWCLARRQTAGRHPHRLTSRCTALQCCPCVAREASSRSRPRQRAPSAPGRPAGSPRSASVWRSCGIMTSSFSNEKGARVTARKAGPHALRWWDLCQHCSGAQQRWVPVLSSETTTRRVQ